MSLRIVADENMPGLEAFERLGSVRRLAGRSLSAADLAEADVLLVRSVTRVDGALLSGTPVRFVGSATIGTDHVELAWLARQGIAFAHAPGCNAMAVAEYVLQALIRWCLARDRDPRTLSLGLVGCGNVGFRVAGLAHALGLRVLACDPPRQEAGLPLAGEAVSLERALEADLVSLHVPLSQQKPHATRHLLDATRTRRLHAGQLLINTCRGAVVDNVALRAHLANGGPATVLDVWEGEPGIDAGLFRHVFLGTPHIAGYSLEGKLRGTAMLFEACREWIGEDGRTPEVTPPEGLFRGDVVTLADLLALLCCRYDLAVDHRSLAVALEEPETGAAFDRLRRHYPVRHECAGLVVEGRVAPEWEPVLSSLGVHHGDSARPDPVFRRRAGPSIR